MSIYMKRKDITVEGWDQYKLIDCGDSRKLESFNGVVTDRPETQALWSKTSPTEIWAGADAQFFWADKGERWKISENIPKTWTITCEQIKLHLSMKGFKHVGIFPEHVKQWIDIMTLCKMLKYPKMLNLFGYTGSVSIAGVLGGADVTHVDASKQILTTLKENIKLSGLSADSIRIVCEDALRYTKRLVERGEKFEIIIMDPPAFGRGPKGEIWKIEDSLQELISLLPKILSPEAKLVILNGYASGYSAQTFGEILREVLPSTVWGGEVTFGDIGIQQTNSDRILTTGIYSSWQK